MNKPKKEITIKDLYPNFTDEQLVEAEENLKKYVLIMMRMTERLVNEENQKFDSPPVSSRSRQSALF